MKRTRLTILLFLCAALLLGPFSAPAAAALNPARHDRGYAEILYNNTNGLPTSAVNDIAQTAEGFLWLGGYAGLMRFDGNSFERMDSTHGIASVVSLFVDSRNRLWVGTNDSGVAVMERGVFTYYGRAEGLPSLSVRCLTEDYAGNIFVATTQGVAVIDAGGALRALDEPLLNDEYIRLLTRAEDGTIYGVTMSGAVFTLSAGGIQQFCDSDALGISGARAVLPDREAPESVYIAGNDPMLYHGRLSHGVFTLTESVSIAPLEFVNSLKQVDDVIWICADNGAGQLCDGAFSPLDNAPLNTSVEHMMADYQGNLWFASSQQGVMKIVSNRFEDLYETYGLPEGVVYSTCLYQGSLFIGTKDEGLLVLRDGKSLEALPLTSSATASGRELPETDLLQTLRGVKIRSILRDSQNRLWISTFGEHALMRYDGKSLTHFTMEDGLPSNRVRMVHERSDGSILAACTGGAAVIEGDRVTRVYDEEDGVLNTEILTIEETGGGDILLGSDGDGIYRLGADGSFTHYSTENGLASDVVLRLRRDRERDVFWFVTSNSLAYLSEGQGVVTVHEFPYSNNFDLYENSRGEMWVLSSNGVYVVPAEQLLANGPITPVFYDWANGLPCAATANSYSELTEDGELYIAGSSSVVRVNIETPFEDTQSLKMSVPYIEADGSMLYPDDAGGFTIPSGTKKLTIYSYVYTYSLSNPQVSYGLSGFDSAQTVLRSRELAPVDYTNLKGGSYRFEMRLLDSLGRESRALVVPIQKELAVYEQLWFRVLRALLGLALLALLTQLYIRRKTRLLEQKHKENQTFIREMTEAFAKIIDMKDKYTNGHSMRVARYTAMLTRELGYDQETVDKYYNIALLHDIGKIGIPPEVLNKTSRLTEEEYEIMKSHSSMGYDALKDISIMPELAVGAGAHHERPDGRGYPNGLKGQEIPRVAQIIAVADMFDAMYSTRPYRRRMNFERVVELIRGASGTQLTADVVDAFLRLVERGEFRDPDDHGGGAMEDIENIENPAHNASPA